MKKANKIILNKRTNWFVAVFGVIWLFFVFTMATILTWGIIDSGKIYGYEFLLFYLGILLFGFLGLSLVLWHLTGKEEITFDPDKLIIKKRGLLIQFPLKLKYEDADYFTLSEDKTPFWAKWWGISGGEISLIFLNQKIQFGQDLKKEEALLIIEKLNDKLFERKK
ncbi:hypothetical protein ML462_15450 [Gramella lutea]|uniref:Uncharacterized protein n=1 Tax=Christiangramia lutea TaxID=1607951 RepID=A0A9X1V5M8_9FLAO|nr:hypothetical protein [Christiangramia lutea]MCH4824568.1 hypothetical protein [Christiangramia lutea]